MNEVREKLRTHEISLVEAIEHIRDHAKERLTDFRLRWLQHELNGYPPRENVLAESSLHEPEYRKLHGQYLAQLSTGEWVDVSDTNLGDYPGFLGVGIGVIEEVINNPGTESIDLPLGEIIKGTQFRLRVTRAQLKNIDESVRNRLVDLIDEISAETPS